MTYAVLGQAVMPEASLNAFVQAGSFGILSLVVIWVGRFLIPRIFAEHQRIIDKFDLALERRDTSLKQMGQEITAEMRTMGNGIRELSGRVQNLEDRTSEHRPMAGG